MIKIKVADVREFIRRSKHIKPNTVVPVLSYIKLECFADNIRLYKTNLQTYCMHEFTGEFTEPYTLLLDDRVFTAALEAAKGDTITITPQGKVEIDKIGSWVETVNIDNLSYEYGGTKDAYGKVTDDFPAFPDADREAITTFNADVLKAIGIAKNFVQANLLNTNYSYVITGNAEDKNVVFATDGYILYVHEFATYIPNLLLDAETCNVISSYQQLNYYSSGNYDFFSAGQTTYGFIKVSHNRPMIKSLLGKINKNDPFEVQRTALVNFCDICTKIPSDVARTHAQWSDAALEGMLLEFKDNNFKTSNKETIPVTKSEALSPFTFFPKVLFAALKPLDYPTIQISKVNKHCYTIWSKDDPDFSCIVMGTVTAA